MNSDSSPIYVPSLRMKTGERRGLLELAEDVKDCIIPHLIVPPVPERDAEFQAKLFDTTHPPCVGTVLAPYWRDRRVFLDLRYLFEDFGEADAGRWLPEAFDLARKAGIHAVPVATVADLSGARRQPYSDAISKGDLKLALRVLADDLIDSKAISDHLNRIVEHLKVAPHEITILLDFARNDLSQPDIVAGVIEGALQDLTAVAPWRSIVFQGTSYPETNPADHGGHVLVERKEWTAWRQAVHFSARTGNDMLFGDYAADCARMAFGKSGGRAIRHYRYTTSTHWLVVRGAEVGDDTSIMRNVCQRILDSSHFAGREFSQADDYIHQTARGLDGPGNSTTWRQINTTHHITRVVHDKGAAKGLRFADRVFTPEFDQLMLF